MLSRREMVLLPLGAAVARKRVATIITEYRQDSHADVIAGRLLEGYEYRGERRAPAVEVISMYTDQVPANDMSRDMAAKHGVKICSTVAEAVRAGVDGVVLVGEHGNYPANEKGQILYPRYELYKQVIEVFRKTGKAVPVFCDKHLSVDWEKAKWMYDQSRELKFPLLAGSSVTVAWRKPELELALETPVERAVVAAHGGKESYGFHALEVLQCMVERRPGGRDGGGSGAVSGGPGGVGVDGPNAVGREITGDSPGVAAGSEGRRGARECAAAHCLLDRVSGWGRGGSVYSERAHSGEELRCPDTGAGGAGGGPILWTGRAAL